MVFSRYEAGTTASISVRVLDAHSRELGNSLTNGSLGGSATTFFESGIISAGAVDGCSHVGIMAVGRSNGERSADLIARLETTVWYRNIKGATAAELMHDAVSIALFIETVLIDSVGIDRRPARFGIGTVSGQRFVVVLDIDSGWFGDSGISIESLVLFPGTEGDVSARRDIDFSVDRHIGTEIDNI